MAAAKAAAPEDADGGNSTEVRDEVGETNMTAEELVDFAKSKKAEAKYLSTKKVDRYNIKTGSGPQGCHLRQISVMGKSQPAKNRNLCRLISNLSRLNWSSERNRVYCSSTVFTLLQQQEVPSTQCLPRNLPCLVLESSNTFLTYT